MNEKIIRIGILVLLIGGTGSFAYHTHIVNAKEAAQKQALLASIEKQQDKEYAAQLAKANAPVVDESHPARYAVKQDTSNSSTRAVTDQEIPTQTPPTTTTPPVQPAQKIIQDPVQAIASLSDADISRLQSYPTYGSTGQGFFASFEDFYTNERANADGFFKKFNPESLSVYNNAKVGWLSMPQLEYRTLIGTVGFRGILTLTYYGDNSFGLTPNVAYQCDAEYQVMNSVETDFALNSIKYLSNFRAVK